MKSSYCPSLCSKVGSRNNNENDSEQRFRLSALLIRRLGITFVLLLSIVSGVCLALTGVLSHPFAIDLPSHLSNAQILFIPFTRILEDLESESKYGWDSLRRGGNCLRYSTREYTARLVQLSGPSNLTEAMSTCRDLPIEIHGQLLKSDWCQDLVCTHFISSSVC